MGCLAGKVESCFINNNNSPCVLQVPALLYSPSHIPEGLWGAQYSHLMHVTDWLPTLAAAADFDPSGR